MRVGSLTVLHPFRVFVSGTDDTHLERIPQFSLQSCSRRTGADESSIERSSQLKQLCAETPKSGTLLFWISQVPSASNVTLRCSSEYYGNSVARVVESLRHQL